MSRRRSMKSWCVIPWCIFSSPSSPPPCRSGYTPLCKYRKSVHLPMSRNHKHILQHQQTNTVPQTPGLFWNQIIYSQSYLLTYMGVFGLVQTRGFCLDGVIRPLHLCVPLLLLLKRKVFTSSFFWYVPSPWNSSKKRKGNQMGQMTIRSIY